MLFSPRNLLGGASALILIWAGVTMLGIRSVSGDSVAEAFYQAFGIFSIGLGLATIALLMTPFTADDQRKDARAWKRCPVCAEVVGIKALKCGHCGHGFAAG